MAQWRPRGICKTLPMPLECACVAGFAYAGYLVYRPTVAYSPDFGQLYRFSQSCRIHSQLYSKLSGRQGFLSGMTALMAAWWLVGGL